MKIYAAVVLGSALSFGSLPAFAEEVVPEPTPEVEPTPEAYVPPAEASNGPGGWAVVDPNTGVVHGVTVCTIDVCGPNGAWGGRMPVEYQGCGTNCVLRFQSNAAPGGNVAGASQGVTWNGDSQRTFTFTNTDSNGAVHTRTLVPENTYRNTGSFEDGFTNIRSRATISDGNNQVDVDIKSQSYNQDRTISLLYTQNDQPVRLFEYLDLQSAANNFKNDMYAFADEQNPATVYTDEETEEVVVVPNEIAKAVKAFADTVVDFLRNVFGLEQQVSNEETVEG